MTDLRPLHELIESMPTADLPPIIGELEALKARAWARMLTAAPTTQQAPTVSATADELAALHKVPRSFFYELARAGRIPSERLGRYVRFNPAAVERALAEDAKTHALRTGKKPRANRALKAPATASLPRGERQAS